MSGSRDLSNYMQKTYGAGSTTSINVSAKNYAWLRDYARKENCALSSLVRYIVEESVTQLRENEEKGIEFKLPDF